MIRALTITVALLLLAPAKALARPPVPPDVFKAVRHYWHLRADRVTAFTVISCETGGTYSTSIGSTRFGLFAFGPWERGRFGYGDTALEQARGAHEYWKVSRWAPWLRYEPRGCGR